MVPLDRLRDEPKMSTSLHRIKQLMRETRDYRNLASFMIGCRNSGRILRKPFVEQIVRNACEQGNEYAIIECLKQADKTGLKLWHHNIAETLMSRATWMAVDQHWTEGAVNRGLGFAESLWIMMQDPKQIQPGLPNPTYNPVIVGVMVQLLATKAVMFHGQKDTQGKVAEYTQRLLAVWNRLMFPINCDKYDADSNLRKWAPIWHGMKMARKVSGITKEMREELGMRVKEVASALETARETLQINPKPASVQPDQKPNYDRRGAKLYEKLSSVSS